MLRLKPVFHLHNDKISSQIRKSITDKYVEQIGKCVLTDITEPGSRLGLKDKGEGEIGKVC